MKNDSSISAVRLELAAGFIRRGWQVIILHDVAAGQCSCLPRDDGKECKPGNQGKHPRMGSRWQYAGLTTAEQIEQWHRVVPEANHGILTGPASGMWALDVDPKNGGDNALEELERANGPLPHTQKHRTGSGGWHLFFGLPPDFIPGSSPGRLPPGLDVRGLNGQVVAPGSRTLLGEYSVEVECAVLPQAPKWLLDLIRPLPTAAPEWDKPTQSAVDDFASAVENPRLRAYANRAAQLELAKLSGAEPGRRGSTAYAVACSLIELSNSPWSGLSAELMYAAYTASAEQAMLAGGDFDHAEARASWNNADKHVRGGGRAMPAEREVSGVLDLPPGGAGAGEWPVSVPPQRAAAPAAPAPMMGGWQIVGSSAVDEMPSAMDNPSSAHTPLPVPTPEGQAALDAWHAQRRETAIQAEVERLAVRAEAKRRLDALTATAHQQAKDRLRAALLDAAGLDDIPEPVPLVKGWLAMDTVARISGPPGSYKSFVILDIAGHVGSGRDWHGCKVRQGTVLVMVAEGASGVARRRRAWEQVNGRMTNVVFLPVPVQTAGGEWDAFVELVATEVKPSLVVLDTQARITVGVDENQATDMGVFVDAVERLRRATGACVLLVHHTAGADGGKARGSTSVLGAVHTELFVKAGKGARPEVVLSAGKQKDVSEIEEFRLDMVAIDLGVDADGDPLTSLVPRKGISFGQDESPDARLNAVFRDIFFEARGGTKAEVFAVAVTERRLMKRSAFYTSWNKLALAGNFAQIEGTQSFRYVPVEDRAGLIGVAAGGMRTTE